MTMPIHDPIQVSIRFTTLLLLTLFATACGTNGSAHHWDYDGAEGPEHWAEMSREFAACEQGRAQSPIDLDTSTPASSADMSRGDRSAELLVAHHEHVVDVLDNGHTIQVTYDDGSTLREGGEEFELRQYHFHAPSEHTVDGRSFPMEMHLVHSSADGELAVLGVLIAEGEHNAAFASIWQDLPDTPGESRHLEHVKVDIDDLLPGDSHYYRYEGSLTTPPCSEGVHWYVFRKPITLSADQIAAFTEIFFDNHRPVQPRNGRALTLRVVQTTDEP